MIGAAMILIGAVAAANDALVPAIEGPWRQIAGDPDLGEYAHKEQQPVDFAIWQAADGTWQLWSCIRHTGCGGHTRLFYRWEGARLTDSDWTPMGIAMEARPDLGEAAGGLQAPHVVRLEERYLMAYGDWNSICFAESKDGKTFERIVQPDGRTAAFTEDLGANTRDPMLVRIGDLWHCYYTGGVNGRGFVFCRTSPDLERWGPSCVVCYGGAPGTSPWMVECPHVVEPEPGRFVLFRNQYYGENARNWVYCSDNPLNFGIDDDSDLAAILPVAAPEIVAHEDEYWIAALLPDLKGIRIARLCWIHSRHPGEPLFDFDTEEGRAGWRIVEGDLDTVFTARPHEPFGGPAAYAIGTAERASGEGFDDARKGIIESPEFAIDAPAYRLYVSGGNNREGLYIAVVETDGGKELARFTGMDANEFSSFLFLADEHRGKPARIRIVDRTGDSWGHINFGSLYAVPTGDAASMPPAP